MDASRRTAEFDRLLALLHPDAVVSADAVAVAMGSPALIAGADEVARMFYNGRAQAARRADLDGFAAAAWSVRRDGVDDEWVAHRTRPAARPADRGAA